MKNILGLSLDQYTLAKCFTVDEAISEEFSKSSISGVKSYVLSRRPLSELLKHYKDNNISLKDLINTIGESHSLSITVVYETMIAILSKEPDNISAINNLSFGYSSSRRETITAAIDSLLIKSSDVLEYIGFIEKTFDWYSNWPIIITNNNISRENRIEIIKRKYKQKDLHKYIRTISSHTEDLDILDDFIEATVTQNNRVKEKLRGEQEIFIRFFIGTRDNPVSYKNYKNSEKFFEKYKHIFSKENIRDLYNRSKPTSSWYCSSEFGNYKSLIKDAFKKNSFTEKIVMAKGHKEFKTLIDNFKDVYLQSTDINEKRAIAEYIVSLYDDLQSLLRDYSESDTLRFSTLISDFPDVFENIIKGFNFDVDAMYLYAYNRQYFSKVEEATEKILSVIPDSLLLEPTYFPDSIMCGVKIKKSEVERYGYSRDVCNRMSVLIMLLKYLKSRVSKSSDKTMWDKFFKNYISKYDNVEGIIQAYSNISKKEAEEINYQTGHNTLYLFTNLLDTIIDINEMYKSATNTENSLSEAIEDAKNNVILLDGLASI